MHKDEQNDRQSPQRENNKPWEHQFDDDRDDHGNLSRTATRKKAKGNRVYEIILWTILILVIASPLIYYAYQQSQATADSNNLADVKVVSSSAKSSSKAASAESPSESTSQASASSESESSQAASSSVSQQASSSSQVASSSTASASYYTVKAGDNLYRIAKNSGISLQTLLSLNGLSSTSSISAGQQLRIK